ncbi:MAG: hypothetical protein ABH986_05815 [archaeon]
MKFSRRVVHAAKKVLNSANPAMRRQKRVFEKQQRTGRKLRSADYLRLVQKQITQVALELRNARNILELSASHEKGHWNNQITRLQKEERRLRSLAAHYRRKTK